MFFLATPDDDLQKTLFDYLERLYLMLIILKLKGYQVEF
jgi:hypothetical protein